MRQLLEQQGSDLGQVAVGAAALGETLDHDALICAERENLKRLQQQYEELLRQAEIEISLERAKIARQRAEVDERLRSYQEQVDKAGSPAPGGKASEKPARSRWLTRLGLSDPDSK